MGRTKTVTDEERLARAREYNRQYQKEHKGSVCEKVKLWQARHKEEIRAQKRDYYWRNREQILATQKAWRDAHIEHARAYERAYYHNNKEKIKANRVASERRKASELDIS